MGVGRLVIVAKNLAYVTRPCPLVQSNGAKLKAHLTDCVFRISYFACAPLPSLTTKNGARTFRNLLIWIDNAAKSQNLTLNRERRGIITYSTSLALALEQGKGSLLRLAGTEGNELAP